MTLMQDIMSGKYSPGPPVAGQKLVSRQIHEGPNGISVSENWVKVSRVQQAAQIGSRMLSAASGALKVMDAASGALGAVASANVGYRITQAAWNSAVVGSGLNMISANRSIKSAVHAAEAVPSAASPLTLQSARAIIQRSSARVSYEGMISGDIATAVSLFKRYGYAINRAFTPSRLDVMSRYSYWQAADATITGRMPEAERRVIAAAFRSGVTVWTDVSAIGTFPSNHPRDGISY